MPILLLDDYSPGWTGGGVEVADLGATEGGGQGGGRHGELHLTAPRVPALTGRLSGASLHSLHIYTPTLSIQCM